MQTKKETIMYAAVKMYVPVPISCALILLLNFYLSDGEVLLSEIFFGKGKNYTITDFIELQGPPMTSLESYVIIIYAWSNYVRKIPRKIFLHQKSIPGSGFFVLGEESSKNTTDFPELQHGEIKRGELTLVTLYKNYRPFSFDLKPTEKNLVDLVAFGEISHGPYLLRKWNPNVRPIKFHQILDEESFSRCGDQNPRNPHAFSLRSATPGKANDCLDPPVFITELHLQQDTDCFIELFSTEPDVSLTPYILQIRWMQNNTEQHMTFDLWNMRTDHNGYFTLGSVYSYLDTDSHFRVLHCGKDLNISHPVSVAIYRSFNLEKDDVSQAQLLSDIMFLPQKHQGHLPDNFTSGNNTIDVIPGLEKLEFSVSWCSDAYILTNTSTIADENNCTKADVLTLTGMTSPSTAAPKTTDFVLMSTESRLENDFSTPASTLPDLKPNDTRQAQSRSLQSPNSSSNGKVIVIVLGCIVGAALLVILVAALVRSRRQQPHNQQQQHQDTDPHGSGEEGDLIAETLM